MIPQAQRRLQAAKAGPRTAPPRSISYRMAPSPNIPTEGHPMSDVKTWIKDTVTNTPVVLFMKGTAQFPQCGFSGRAIQILKAIGVDNIATVNVLEDPEVRQGIKDYSNWPTVPQLYVNGEFIGGTDIMNEMYESGELQAMFTK
jgi:monothiol glutaredoxin